MKNTVLILLLLAATIAAQPPATISQGSKLVSPIVNSNFLGLYTGRVGRWTGAGLPGDLPFSIIGDLYFDTTAQGTTYACYRVHCTAVASSNWVRVITPNPLTIQSTLAVLRGDNNGNAVAVTGTGANCLHVDATSSPCPSGGASIPATTSALKGDNAGNALAVTGTGTNCVHVDGSSAACPGGGATVPSTLSTLRGDNTGNAQAVTGTGTNCVHVDGTSASCPGGGATIPSTTSALKGDNAGNALAVTGTGTNCVHVDGTSATCPGGGAIIPNTTSTVRGDNAGSVVAITGTGTNCVHVDGTSASCPGGGTGVINLTTCAVQRTSGSVLTIAASVSDPCNIRVGNVVTQYTANATLTISAGTGTARIGFDTSVNPPVLKVYQGGLTFACSGMTCNSVAGAAFGADDIEIATATATSGNWDSNGLLDLRALAGKDRVVAGTYMTSAISAGTQTVAVDKDALFFPTTDPGCTLAGHIGRQWMDATSAITTHFKVCANVNSTPTWVTVF